MLLLLCCAIWSIGLFTVTLSLATPTQPSFKGQAGLELLWVWLLWNYHWKQFSCSTDGGGGGVSALTACYVRLTSFHFSDNNFDWRWNFLGIVCFYPTFEITFIKSYNQPHPYFTRTYSFNTQHIIYMLFLTYLNTNNLTCLVKIAQREWAEWVWFTRVVLHPHTCTWVHTHVEKRAHTIPSPPYLSPPPPPPSPPPSHVGWGWCPIYITIRCY